jgi:hypothetical protein
MGGCAGVDWMTNFCVGLFFPVLVDVVGISATFFLFAGVGVFALLFTWAFLPETRGKSLERLELEFFAEDWHALKKRHNGNSDDDENGGRSGSPDLSQVPIRHSRIIEERPQRNVLQRIFILFLFIYLFILIFNYFDG